MTKGPWTDSKELSRRWIEGADGSVVADQIATRADAILIAAAPEMLDLLRELEWSGENIHRDPECPVCGGDKESSGGSEAGHAPDCRLAGLLARYPR